MADALLRQSRFTAGLGITINKEMMMDEAKKVKIEQLAATAHDKSEQYKMLGMMNTPSEPAAKKQSAIEYAVVRGEMIEANRALVDALNA